MMTGPSLRRCSRISPASMKPSISGMWASVITKGNGWPSRSACAHQARAPRQRWRRRWAPSANWPALRRESAGWWRCRPPPAPACRAGRPARRPFRRPRRASASARPRRTVKWNRLPRPTSLSSQILPPIRSTSRAAIASPRPVPPWRRVVELSACSNMPKTTACFSDGMPMPVSLTVKCSVTFVLGGRIAGHFHHHFAALRELDGVVHQIHHHLPQAVVIAHQPGRHVAVDVAGQLQPLLVGAEGERFQRVAQALAEVEPLLLQHELFGLDLGKIEDVVDHPQQGLARIADGGQVFALLLREMALEDQFGHADHGVQRRADFVAHVGQECALGAAGRFGRFFGGPQGLGVQHLRGDVLRDAESAHDVPRVVQKGQFGGGGPGRAPVGPGLFLYLGDDPLPGADDFLLVVPGPAGRARR